MNKIIIDVRTPEEYSMGHVKNAINIPLQELNEHMKKLEEIKGEIILCCASGVRSAKAYRLLQQNGFSNISNGGSWIDLETTLVHE